MTTDKPKTPFTQARPDVKELPVASEFARAGSRSGPTKKGRLRGPSMTRVSALQWLSTAQASRVVENLKQWQNRVTNKEGV
ncbi:hypothetical protein SAMN04487857_12253 [Pseudomonas sp. ok272]|nr:hypothetical protein SAMN04487857_12253 [Pseudomonas sp. ok272]